MTVTEKIRKVKVVINNFFVADMFYFSFEG